MDIACATLNGMKMDDKTLNVRRATARLALVYFQVLRLSFVHWPFFGKSMLRVRHSLICMDVF